MCPDWGCPGVLDRILVWKGWTKIMSGWHASGFQECPGVTRLQNLSGRFVQSLGVARLRWEDFRMQMRLFISQCVCDTLDNFLDELATEIIDPSRRYLVRAGRGSMPGHAQHSGQQAKGVRKNPAVRPNNCVWTTCPDSGHC